MLRLRGTKDSSARAVAFTALFALLVCTSLLTFGARAKQKDKKGQQPTTGRIEVSTNPAGYPITIDGSPAGETTDYVRAIELAPGTHTVEILFPNNTRWSQVFNIVAGRKNCIALNYRPRTISIPAIAASPCPYPVNVTAPAAVNDGDVITFAADVQYAGPSALNYTWTVSPPAARILSGAGTPAVDYLAVNRGISRARLVFVNGGLRDADAFELWLVPQGAEPPRPTPTVTPDQLRPATPARRHD